MCLVVKAELDVLDKQREPIEPQHRWETPLVLALDEQYDLVV